MVFLGSVLQARLGSAAYVSMYLIHCSAVEFQLVSAARLLPRCLISTRDALLRHATVSTGITNRLRCLRRANRIAAKLVGDMYWLFNTSIAYIAVLLDQVAAT